MRTTGVEPRTESRRTVNAGMAGGPFMPCTHAMFVTETGLNATCSGEELDLTVASLFDILTEFPMRVTSLRIHLITPRTHTALTASTWLDSFMHKCRQRSNTVHKTQQPDSLLVDRRYTPQTLCSLPWLWHIYLRQRHRASPCSVKDRARLGRT